MCVNISPRVVTLRRTGKTVVVNVPCGRCIECLKKRQNDWKLRLCHESSEWSHCYFFTLTYRNDMLPCRVVNRDVFGEVYFSGTYPECQQYVSFHPDCDLEILSSANKSEIQAFIKRIREDVTRKFYGSDPSDRWPMKYFVCAEYGPNPRGTKRPHYHGILFCNEGPEVLKPYFFEWFLSRGRIDFQEVGVGREDRSSVANYISKYCAKGCFESRLEDIEHGLIEKAWTVMSKNIGQNWLRAHINDYLKYVPTCLSIDGDWSVEDIEQFFSSHTDDSIALISIINKELDDLIRNLRVFDGDVHGYKMPRYYFDRIINKPVVSDRLISTNTPNLKIAYGTEFSPQHFAFFSSPEAITFETRVSKDKRYVPESFLSRALSYRLRMLALERSRRLAQKLIDDDGLSIAEADLSVARYQAFALTYRERSATSSLQSFYDTNMWNHREFDE